MRVLTPLAATLALAFALPAATAADLPPRPTVGDIVKASKPGDWRPLDPQNTLYMELPSGRVVIELAPDFVPGTAANIRALARENYFDGLAIIRSQDNYVVQWGDPDEEHPRALKKAAAKVKAEFTVPMAQDKHFVAMPDKDGYAPQVGHSHGFPSARDPKSGRTWLAHCYGMVGVARDNDPDSGNGSQLYVVTGNAPRHLDRNITVAGRVVSGMALLSTLPRGTGPLGFYEKPEQRLQIKSVRLAADVPEAERSKLEVMRTETDTYAKVVDAARNRGGPWTVYSPGYVELCNAPIPVREQK
ncbi:peptidylprolyl isomerase [Massilia arenosa]|uniref:peptidylprolyl isomerase n=1 Tax=Zemynaea arenosa TaxID=2561931 RepID=A0A4Y9SNQ4_9BURK|nr:peptidylprolyl isomerase [Massilia arenosa]TFW26574.1 peptidylprolyl isomerase [Massilia arenosa]